jgi:dCMP deaminase
LNRSRIYLPWFPCVGCARAIVQTGIVELVAMMPDLADLKWGEDFAVSLEMFEEARIAVLYLEP